MVGPRPRVLLTPPLLVGFLGPADFFFVRNPNNIRIQFLFHTLLYCHSSVFGASKVPTVAHKLYNLLILYSYFNYF